MTSVSRSRVAQLQRASVVWRESLRGTYISDIAIRVRAENPGWSLERVADEATRAADADTDAVERCFRNRKQADPRGAQELPAAKR